MSCAVFYRPASPGDRVLPGAVGQDTDNRCGFKCVLCVSWRLPLAHNLQENQLVQAELNRSAKRARVWIDEEVISVHELPEQLLNVRPSDSVNVIISLRCFTSFWELSPGSSYGEIPIRRLVMGDACEIDGSSGLPSIFSAPLPRVKSASSCRPWTWRQSRTRSFGLFSATKV